MKIIYSKYIPVKGFRAINLFGVIVVRKDSPQIDRRLLHHERIHSRQMVELLVVGFYLWYVVEWLVRLMVYRNGMEAYRNICFEREAHANDCNYEYLKQRRPWSFVRYILKEKQQ